LYSNKRFNSKTQNNFDWYLRNLPPYLNILRIQMEYPEYKINLYDIPHIKNIIFPRKYLIYISKHFNDCGIEYDYDDKLSFVVNAKLKS
jgi:hypothetical protein